MSTCSSDVLYEMGQKDQKGFCGCCSLKTGGIITGLLASIYNGALMYWFAKTADDLRPNDDYFTVHTTLLVVLSCLAAVHIAVSLLLVYAILKSKPDLVMMWIVTYVSSCLVVASLFTVGLAFMLNKLFLYTIFCNFLFIFNVVMTVRLYRDMVENIKTEEV